MVNGLQKIFLSIMGSIVVIFVIWTIMFFVNENPNPNMIQYYHLDLQATFRKLNLFWFDDENQDFYSNIFLNTFRSFSDTIQNFNNPNNSFINKIVSIIDNNDFLGSSSTAFQFILNAVNAIFNPIYFLANSMIVTTYIIVMITELVGLAANFVMGVYEFLFAPIFVYVPPVQNQVLSCLLI